MTTIAFDGSVLAADRRGINGGTPIQTQKIFRVGNHLVGFAGDYVLAVAWLRWMRGGEPPPMGDDPHSLRVMVVDERRNIWTADLRRVYVKLNRPQWAIGSGADYALAAMELKHTAIRAVRIAAKLDINTGGGVSWLTIGRGR